MTIQMNFYYKNMYFEVMETLDVIGNCLPICPKAKQSLMPL